MTGPLTARQVEDLLNLVQGALDAREDYERACAEPIGVTAESQSAWDRRVVAAHEAAWATKRAAFAAIRALRGAS